VAIGTVVLVHGAFADGSCWAKVIPLLTKRGLKALAVQNPLSSLADDVVATHRVVNMQSGPVLMVGHSWGGAVITEAGNHPKVKALVYVAAGAPDSGQSFGDWWKPASMGTLCYYTYRMAEILDVLHEMKLYYRDFLLSYIVLDMHGRPMLIDPGLISLADLFTTPFALKGREHYMAPENFIMYYDDKNWVRLRKGVSQRA